MLGKNVTLVFGPPGTGKTTALIETVSKHLLAGVPLDKIAYVSFTRRAASEARERISKKHGISPVNLKWFRTLHSLAYKFLGIQRTEMMGPADYSRISTMIGQALTVKGVPVGLAEGATYGDKLLFYESQARVKGLTIRQLWQSLPPHEAVSEFDLLHTERVLARYKQSTTRLDFVDLINRFVEQGKSTPFEIVFIDEAQDLSPRQWDMVEIVCQGCQHAYVAGDDDQAIYQWAGADAAQMMKFRGWGEEIVLPVSYRVPARIKPVADQIIARITGGRVAKNWSANPDSIGSVTKIPMWHLLKCDQGSWMFLARNQYMLEDVVTWCQTEGYTYETTLDYGVVRTEMMQAFLTWRKLITGQSIFAEQALTFYDVLRRGQGYLHGSKAKIERQDQDTVFTLKELQKSYGLTLKETDTLDVVLPRATQVELGFFQGAKQNIPIRISTIHGVKGAEADNVVLFTDLSASTYQGFAANPDPEHRLWYVAVTRARCNLIVIEPKNHLLKYEIPI